MYIISTNRHLRVVEQTGRLANEWALRVSRETCYDEWKRTVLEVTPKIFLLLTIKLQPCNGVC